MKHKIEIAPNLAICIDGERVIGSKPHGLFLTTEMIVSDEDLKRLSDRCLEVIADTPQTETDFWASVTRDDWLKAHGLDADTPQTEEPPCMGKPCGICNERNYCKFAERTDTPQTETSTNGEKLQLSQTDCGWK